MEILAAVVLISWVAAFIRTIVNLLLIPTLRPGSADGPPVSIVIPARNEERSIGETVTRLLRQTYRKLELIVVDDGSTDATPDILRKIGEADSRLIVLRNEETPDGWLGKPWALHRGAEVATGELLLFVDADISYEPDAVAAMVARLRESGVAMLSALPRLEMRGFWENALIPQLAMTIFSFLPTWLGNRTKIRMLGVGGGPGNMVWRNAYDLAGGHVALRAAVVDDVGLARLIRQSGQRTEAVRSDGLISVRIYHGLHEIVHGFTKNAFSVLNRNYVAALVVAILTILFHVLPYAMALAGSRVAVATVLMITATRLLLFSVLRYSLLSALFLHPVMNLAWTYIFLRSMWITGVRRKLTWRGRDYDPSRTRFGADR